MQQRHGTIRISRTPTASTETGAFPSFTATVSTGECANVPSHLRDTLRHRDGTLRHEAADERTRKFLGMLAHEFRNILGPIQNSALLLKQKPLDADARKAVEMIERQADRLLALVEDLRRINPKD